jgi:hypothetical protein
LKPKFSRRITTPYLVIILGVVLKTRSHLTTKGNRLKNKGKPKYATTKHKISGLYQFGIPRKVYFGHHTPIVDRRTQKEAYQLVAYTSLAYPEKCILG